MEKKFSFVWVENVLDVVYLCWMFDNLGMLISDKKVINQPHIQSSPVPPFSTMFYLFMITNLNWLYLSHTFDDERDKVTLKDHGKDDIF